MRVAAANEPGATYDRSRYVNIYSRRAYGYYKPHHVQRGISMILKAVGLRPNGRLSRILTGLACRLLHRRHARLARAGY